MNRKGVQYKINNINSWWPIQLSLMLMLIYLSSAVYVKQDKVSSCTQLSNIGNFVVYKNNILDELQTRDIYIYWQNLNDNCSIYCIRTEIRDNKNYVFFSNTLGKSYALFKELDYNIEYKFMLFSINENDLSTYNTTIIVPIESVRKRIPFHLTKIVTNQPKMFKLSWNNDDSLKSFKYNERAYHCLYWCEIYENYIPYTCRGDLYWKILPISTSSTNITVKNHWKNYHFAISVYNQSNVDTVYPFSQYVTSSSGMFWESCSIFENKIHTKMEQIHVGSISSTHIELFWATYKCMYTIAKIEGYHLLYCRVASIDCAEPMISVQKNIIKPLENNTLLRINQDITSLVITKLKPLTTYLFSVAVVTNYGEGIPSDPLFVTTQFHDCSSRAGIKGRKPEPNTFIYSDDGVPINFMK